MSLMLSESKYSTFTASCQAENELPEYSSSSKGRGSLSTRGRGGENSIPGKKKDGVAGFDYKHFREELKSAWSEWLDGMEWDWYVTLTFKKEIHPEQAERNFGRWVRRLNEKRHGMRFRKKGKGISWVRAIEMQRRGVIHFHVLLKGLEGVRYLRGHRLWRVSGKRNGFSWIEPYHPHKGATGYLGKYIGKGGDIDVFLMDRMKPERKQQSVPFFSSPLPKPSDTFRDYLEDAEAWRSDPHWRAWARCTRRQQHSRRTV